MLFAMEKQHFFFKLIPARPTFPQDMTDKERLLMKDHARYIGEFLDAGKILLMVR
jgi:hypothetical protein